MGPGLGQHSTAPPLAWPDRHRTHILNSFALFLLLNSCRFIPDTLDLKSSDNKKQEGGCCK